MNSGISFESRQLHRLKLHIKQPLKKKKQKQTIKMEINIQYEI